MKSILSLLFGLFCTISFGQECLDAKYNLSGYFYAGTSIIDTTNIGGFASSKNAPKKITKSIERLADQNAFSIIADNASDQVFQQKFKGFKVFIVNTTDSLVSVPAEDSRLYVKRQVYYENKWQDIEYLHSSWCGNSYHNVNLASNHYWEFIVPCVQGKIQAMFRFEFKVDEGEILYSNTFYGSFNKSRLEKIKKHKSKILSGHY